MGIFQSRTLLGMLFSLSAAWCDPVQPLWSYAHPNAKSLVGIDVGALRKSALGRAVEQRYLPDLAKSFAGIDLLDQVDRVLISSPGGKGADHSGEPPILIAIRGHFDLTRVREVLRQHRLQAQTFKPVRVYRPQGKAGKDFAVAVVDTYTILVGDAQSIFSTIERLQFPPPENANALFRRAAVLDAECDFWALMSSPGALASQSLPFAGIVPGLNELEAAITVREGLSADISISASSNSKARELKDTLAKLLKLAASDQASRPELALLAKKPKWSVQGSRVVLSIRIPAGQLETSLQSLQARNVAKAPISVPANPQRQVIRIEGLDEGPRELLYRSNP